MDVKGTFARMDEEKGECVRSDHITNLVGDGLAMHCRVKPQNQTRRIFGAELPSEMQGSDDRGGEAQHQVLMDEWRVGRLMVVKVSCISSGSSTTLGPLRHLGVRWELLLWFSP